MMFQLGVVWEYGALDPQVIGGVWAILERLDLHSISLKGICSSHWYFS